MRHDACLLACLSTNILSEEDSTHGIPLNLFPKKITSNY